MKVLVTGGGGFLGSAIVRALKKQGHQVAGFSRRKYPQLENEGIESLTGDLSDGERVTEVLKGFEAVIHTGARPGIWGPYEEYYRTNYLGTENIIRGCMANKIRRLVYTSSPSVVFDGTDQEGVDESHPYPGKFLAHYPKTKAMAEKLVMESSGQDLYTVSLRPHLIWGPGDNHLIPRLISRAKTGRLRLVGNGENLVDTVYIDNASDAHLLALERLTGEKAAICGKTYFITNGEPMKMADIFNGILKTANLGPVTKKIPFEAAYAAGAMMELFYAVTGKKEEPLMTRFLALELKTAHWFNISAARRDLGYEPKISFEEGLRRLRV